MCPDQAALPRRQRVAAYAVIVRSGRVLLSRLAPSVSDVELWTLPGGGIDFGESPADAVVREVHEETGLRCVLGDPLWVGSAHRVVDPDTSPTEMHSVRIVYRASVAADAPEPRVVEVDGSTIDARWVDLADVRSAVVPTVPMVLEALSRLRPLIRQRLAAYALVQREDQVLLTRNSARGPHPGVWTLPGGGVDHGERPACTWSTQRASTAENLRSTSRTGRPTTPAGRHWPRSSPAPCPCPPS
jgi:8-oxo-dGTP diphosphatase